MFAVPVDVVPVKYAFGTNVNISSVPARRGYAGPVDVTTVALLLASEDTTPYPRNTVTDPELIILY